MLYALPLAACTVAPPPPTQADAARAMTGMPAPAVASCMGRPSSVSRINNAAVWRYTSSGGSGAYTATPSDLTSVNFQYAPFAGALPPDPAFQSAVAGPLMPQCTVRLTLEGGKVVAVGYLGPNETFVQDSSYCGDMVRRCMK